NNDRSSYVYELHRVVAYISVYGSGILCSFLLQQRREPLSTPFPYTTLFRSPFVDLSSPFGDKEAIASILSCTVCTGQYGSYRFLDRKSTRLNSSHVKISYAVFCLKKKK